MDLFLSWGRLKVDKKRTGRGGSGNHLHVLTTLEVESCLRSADFWLVLLRRKLMTMFSRKEYSQKPHQSALYA